MSYEHWILTVLEEPSPFAALALIIIIIVIFGWEEATHSDQSSVKIMCVQQVSQLKGFL